MLEMESIKSNHVQDFVDLSRGWKIIGNKQVLKVKHQVDGSFERYKACLVAKGYTQKESVNYEKTFFLVIKFALIHLTLTIVVYLDVKLYQIDVKTTFLNRKLDDEIYMDQPTSFVVEDEKHKVCELR